ncbi:hypothetical protein SAY87_020831 [Trapa incisa]|uniref:Uncharacterized protein n=1 Tax=Trapa incisa TaxID=236973 RepID=A0AAN7JWB2_9MYRT|nr:hypothetical protein SAY87_020831 [Trapa incisa]
MRFHELRHKTTNVGVGEDFIPKVEGAAGLGNILGGSTLQTHLHSWPKMTSSLLQGINKKQ